MDVQIATDEPGRRHDVTRAELDDLPGSARHVDDLGVDAPLDALESRDAITSDGKRRPNLSGASIDERTRTRGAEVVAERRIDGAAHAAHGDARKDRKTRIRVEHADAQLSARQHLEEQILPR